MAAIRYRCSTHGRQPATVPGWRALHSTRTTPGNGTALSCSKLSFDSSLGSARTSHDRARAIANLPRYNRATRSLLIIQEETVKAFTEGANAFPVRLGAPHTQGLSTSQLYGLFVTTCGAGLLTSSWALTFWICAACSLSCPLNSATVASNASTLRFSMAL